MATIIMVKRKKGDQCFIKEYTAQCFVGDHSSKKIEITNDRLKPSRRPLQTKVNPLDNTQP